MMFDGGVFLIINIVIMEIKNAGKNLEELLKKNGLKVTLNGNVSVVNIILKHSLNLLRI